MPSSRVTRELVSGILACAKHVLLNLINGISLLKMPGNKMLHTSINRYQTSRSGDCLLICANSPKLFWLHPLVLRGATLVIVTQFFLTTAFGDIFLLNTGQVLIKLVGYSKKKKKAVLLILKSGGINEVLLTALLGE